MLNDIVIMGRLTKDPIYRETDSFKQTRFTIACERDYPNRDGKRDADFVKVVCWGKTAEFTQKYFNKGDMIIVRGRLQIDVDKSDDNYREYTSINADTAYFGGARKTDDEQPAPRTASKPADADDYDARFHELNGDDAELPFD